MRTVRLEDYIAENRGRFARVRLQLDSGRKPSCRERNPRERELLLRLDRARRERWIAEGKLVVLGPRRYILRLDPDGSA